MPQSQLRLQFPAIYMKILLLYIQFGVCVGVHNVCQLPFLFVPFLNKTLDNHLHIYRGRDACILGQDEAIEIGTGNGRKGE